MPRKMRTPKAQIAALPQPAWTYWLMTGAPAIDRLPGWVSAANEGRYGEPTVAAVWEQHRAALLDEAEAHGFEPAFETNRVPTGQAYEAWRSAFLAQHTY
jgi:hypothetical protein